MISLFRIQGKSMEPSLKEGDFVFVNRMSYLFSFPQIGHVVVVRDPSYADRVLVKRVLAERQENKQSWYWVEGDNKQASYDSRKLGWIEGKAVLGRAKVIHKTGPFAHDILS